jgi:hypothetical protein
MLSRKNRTSAARPPRGVIKQGYWVLRTTDPGSPAGEVVDPVTGTVFECLDKVIPTGWTEVFRGEYLPGARLTKNRRARVFAFPHEIIIVDPRRRGVMIDGTGSPARGSISAQTCIPVWITPA